GSDGRRRGRAGVDGPGGRAQHRRRDETEAWVSASERRELLAAVLGALIPAEGGFPAAGAIVLDHVLSMAAASSELDALLAGVLRAVAEAVGGGDFSTLAVDEREAVLREVERAHPDAFHALLGHTHAAYYTPPPL